MHRFARRFWLQWFLVAALVLMGNALAFYRSSIRLNDQNHQVSHAHDVLEALDGVLAATDDAETGQRGYILTGNASYLQPYTLAVRAIDARLGRLDALTAADPSSRAEVAVIARDVHAKFAELARTVALRRGGNANAANRIVLSGVGESLMQQVRARISRLRATMNATLAARQQTAEASASALDITLAVATGASAVLLGLLGLFAWRRLERREREAAERAALLQREQAARAEAEEAIKVRNQFLVAVSHELNTPLAALIGGVQLLERRLSRGEQGRQDRQIVEVVVAQTARLRATVDTLLDVARLQSGQLILQVEPLDLDDVVEHALLEVRPALVGQRITTRFEAGGLIVQGDAQRLEGVVGALLHIVARYAQPEGRLDIRLVPDDGALTVTISSDGAAIPLEALPSQGSDQHGDAAAARRQVQDVGMRLHIASEIIRSHGGSLDIQSGEGRGTTIAMSLPAGEAGVAEPLAG